MSLPHCLIGYAHALKVEALAGLGELLKQTPKQGGGRYKKGGGSWGSRKEPQLNAPPTLAEMGIEVRWVATGPT